MEKDYTKLDGYKGAIKPEFFKKIQEAYRVYRDHKKNFDERINENNKWYKSQHWDIMKSKTAVSSNAEAPDPVIPHLFNAIQYKHADAMDMFPEANILARAGDDENSAKLATDIIPLELDMAGFKKVYRDNWWYKLKNGACCYGVFFNPQLCGGLGDIDIKKIDLKNVFWEPGVTDIQDSTYFFVTSLINNDKLKSLFPEKADYFVSGAEADAQVYNDGQNTNQSDVLTTKR